MNARRIQRTISRLLTTCSFALLLGLTLSASRATAAVFKLPKTIPYVSAVTAGPDGNIWFTDGNIGRITPGGTITEYPLPYPSDQPKAIATGPDGNLWFTDFPAVSRITPSGQITEYPLPRGVEPIGITAGPDGDLWFTERAGDKIGRITPSGQITEYSLPKSGSEPSMITAGPDGNLWFTEHEAIGRITPAGQVSEFSLPSTATPSGITAGPNGSVWFTESTTNAKIAETAPWAANAGKVDRIAPGGQITEYPVSGDGTPTGITDGQAGGQLGDLWFIDSNKNARGTPAGGSIDSVSPRGRISSVAALGGSPSWITSGSEGNLWYTTTAESTFAETAYGGGPPAIGVFSPPPLEAFIEIPDTTDTVHRGWTRQKIVCGGGSASTSCRGILRLSVEVRHPPGHGGSTTYVIAHRRYNLGWESSRSIALHLTKRALSLAAGHEGVLQSQLVATNPGGQSACKEVFLDSFPSARPGT
jgi:streptogramin lyase